MAVHSSSGGSMATFWGQAAGSIDVAIAAAVDAAKGALEGHTLEWLELAEVRGGFEGDGTLQYQVAVRIGYS